MLTDRSFEYWTPEPLFAGETVFCVASGPSLTQETCDRLRGRRVIVVNSSWRLAPWADVLFFTDSGWFEANRAVVTAWEGLVVSMSRTAKRELPDKVKRVRGFGQPTFPPRRFPPLGDPHILQGRSSGHTAIALAIGLGASRVAMVGYDMRLVNGREHFHHDERIYQAPRDLTLYENEFVPGFKGWQAASQVSGVEIVNCTPGSAVTEFPFADLDQLVGGA